MGKKLNILDFINKSSLLHHNKYDYSKVVYKNSKTKVCIICPEHGEFWQTPKNHMNGQGCPKCNKSKDILKSNLSNFINKSNKKFNNKYFFPYINMEYKNIHSKLTIKCNDCGSVFIKIAGDHLSSENGGCKNCLNNSKKKYITYNEINKIAKSNKIKFFDGKKCINTENVIAICPKHGEYSVKIKSVINNTYSCKKCIIERNNKNRKIDLNTFKKRFEPINDGTISFNVNDFNGMASNMNFKCNVCGFSFKRKPSVFVNGNLKFLCPNCGKNSNKINRTKTTDDFINECKMIYGPNEFDYSKTIYNGSSSKVKIKCNKCNKYFEIEANSHLRGHGCPYHFNNKSKQETELFEYIKSLSNDAEQSNKTVLNGSEIDIYIPSKNIGFEYNGLYWHNELNKDKNYHLNKTVNCENNNIRLIHIFEDEWLYKKDIVKSMISNFLGATKKRIYARKCEIREINGSESNEFLDKNHLQGKCNGTIKIGLYYENKLVSLMVFGKSRHFVGNGKYEYELLRFCNIQNTIVCGGASKIFNYFIKKYNPNNIVSYADRRWSVGNLYNQLGFTLYNKSKPNYYYIIGNKRFYRFSLRKSVLIKKYNCPSNITEKEFCFKQKWYRIYDCGCLCYEWKNLETK